MWYCSRSSSFRGVVLLSCRVANSLESLWAHHRIPTQALQVKRRRVWRRAGCHDQQRKGRALSQDIDRRYAHRIRRSLCAGNSIEQKQHDHHPQPIISSNKLCSIFRFELQHVLLRVFGPNLSPSVSFIKPKMCLTIMILYNCYISFQIAVSP